MEYCFRFFSETYRFIFRLQKYAIKAKQALSFLSLFVFAAFFLNQGEILALIGHLDLLNRT